MKQKAISGQDLSKTLTSEDLLGKDVVDFDGSIIGVVEKVLIDPSKLDFVGISIDRGFLKNGLTIGRDYVEEIKEHAVFLKIKVSYQVKGKMVFDNEGRIVGVVSSIELYENMNKIISLIVKKPSYFLSQKEIVIPANKIRVIGDNVMLNVSKDELK